MKIVHFGKFYPPEFGGIESVTQALAEDHSRGGHDVEVVCFSRLNSSVDRRDRLVIRRVKMQAEKMSQPIALGYLRACAQAVRNADVVHVHLPNMLAAIAVLRLPRRVKVLLHWHSDIEGKGIVGRLIRPIERAMLCRADHIVTTSENYAKSSRALASFLENVTTVPIGIADVQNLSKVVRQGRPYVLFVGRIVPYKGLSCLLEAAAKVKADVDFYIIGTGPQEAELIQLARVLDVSHKVNFCGRVNEEELEYFFQNAAIFCLPSINRLEAFGVVLLEAMRASLPLITTDIEGSGVPWVNSCGSIVPVGDAQALAMEIDRFVANPIEAAKVGCLGRGRFEREFLREQMSERFLTIYSEGCRETSERS